MGTITNVNIGTTANDGTGDTLRAGFDKINTNISNLNTDKSETTHNHAGVYVHTIGDEIISGIKKMIGSVGGALTDFIVSTDSGSKYRQTFRSDQASGLFWMWGTEADEDAYMTISNGGGQNRIKNNTRSFNIFRSSDASPDIIVDGTSGNVGLGGASSATNKLLVTGAIETTGNIELGNASDTTIARESAGVITVEGITVIIAGSTTAGQVPTITGINTYSWQTPTSGSAFWTAIPGTPTRVSNTAFTITGNYTTSFTKGMIVKWTESAIIRTGMISIPSTYGAPDTTITIIGDTMASIDVSSLKYTFFEVIKEKFSVAGSIGATGTNVSNAYYAPFPMRVLGADLQVGTSGTTNNTTIDINKNGTTMFTTKPTLATTVARSPLPFTADTTSVLALGDKVTIDIDAIQTTPAVDLYTQLYIIPTRINNLT